MLTNLRSSCLDSSLWGCRTTHAPTTSPYFGSGTAIAAASITASCAVRAFSICTGKRFCRKIHEFKTSFGSYNAYFSATNNNILSHLLDLMIHGNNALTFIRPTTTKNEIRMRNQQGIKRTGLTSQISLFIHDCLIPGMHPKRRSILWVSVYHRVGLFFIFPVSALSHELW